MNIEIEKMTITIVKASAKMLDLTTLEEGIDALKRIEYIGRISHRSEDRITDYSYARFIESVVMHHGDLSIIEHVSCSVEVEVDRGITHEIVRHRLGAYTQESTRFVNYSKDGQPPRFIMPDFVEPTEQQFWKEGVEQAATKYQTLLELGNAPQIARSILPTALASKLVITYNLRMWRHFFIMRTTKEAHPQMREVTIPLLEQFQHSIPILFDDIKPNAKQSDNMRLLR